MGALGDDLYLDCYILCDSEWKSNGDYKSFKGDLVGGPISPYLFLLCAKALSALLNKDEQKGVITGVLLFLGALG